MTFPRQEDQGALEPALEAGFVGLALLHSPRQMLVSGRSAAFACHLACALVTRDKLCCPQNYEPCKSGSRPEPQICLLVL